MIRDWIRAFRRKGIAAFLMPSLVLVMMVYGYVEYVDGYFENLDEADTVSTKLESTQEEIRIAREMDKRKIVLKPDYDLWQSRAFIAPTREAALEAMKASLTQTLQNLYFEKVQIDVPKVDATDAGKNAKTADKTTDLIALEAQFIGVPQQLPRLEAELQTQAQSIRVSEVKIKAVVPPPPAPAKAAKALKAVKVLPKKGVLPEPAAAASAPASAASNAASTASTEPYLEITVRLVAPYLATAAVVTATAPMPVTSAASKPSSNTK